MTPYCKLAIVLTISLAASCARTGIVGNDVPVTLAKPEKVVSVCRDISFDEKLPEVLNSFDIQIVNDTVLVVSDQISEENHCHFKAYSTNTFDYLGAFIREGRGPGEMIDPRLSCTDASERYLYIKNNMSDTPCLVDVEASLESNNTVTAGNFTVPAGTFDWVLMPDGNEQFVLRDCEEIIAFQVANKDGKILKTIDMYKGHNSSRHAIYMSSLHVRKSGMVAEAMVCFPQINFIDTKSGKVRSVAPDKEYRNWKSVIARRFDMEMKEYYSGAAATAEYIFGAYKGISLNKLREGSNGTSIHVFDWEGNFPYEIKVAENLGHMTFDGKTGFLYAVAKPEGRIVRYDLSGLLPKN